MVNYSLQAVMQQTRNIFRISVNSITVLCLLLLFVTSSFAESIDKPSPQVLEGFDAKYKAYKYGRSLGHANMSLESKGHDEYLLTYNSKVSLFFMSDKRSETSEFQFRDNKIQPRQYKYRRSGTGKNKSLEAVFDDEQKLIRLGKEDSMPWMGELDNQLYRLDVQIRLAQGQKEIEYDLINYRGEKRHYIIEVVGKEQLSLPYGMLEGVKVRIARENSRRETFAWFSPELNYQLVRLQQFKDGDEQGDIRLSEFKLHSSQTASVQ